MEKYCVTRFFIMKESVSALFQIMEINPENTIEIKDLAMLLFKTSLLTSGFSLEDPNTYLPEKVVCLQERGSTEGLEHDVSVEELTEKFEGLCKVIKEVQDGCTADMERTMKAQALMQNAIKIDKDVENLGQMQACKQENLGQITELPLDNGVRSLLRGCTKLRRFAFYVRPRALPDLGLSYVGEFSKTVRYMLLGNAGSSDDRVITLARDCPSLQKLELRSRCFTERAIAVAPLQLKSLRYLWVQGYRASPTGSNLSAMDLALDCDTLSAVCEKMLDRCLGPEAGVLMVQFKNYTKSAL